MEGCLLDQYDCCDVVQSKTEGFSESLPLGDSDSIAEGQAVTNRALLGIKLGCNDAMYDGQSDKLGLLLIGVDSLVDIEG